MTFDELKAYIFTTRQTEGVAWYFGDLSQNGALLGELHCFNTDGSKTAAVLDIRPDNDGHIPKSTLKAIADARSRCGPSSNFLDRRRAAGQPAMEIYSSAFTQWTLAGAQSFVEGPITTAPA